MLFKQETLAGIAAGRIDLAFRRWRQARVRDGSRLRTAVGVVEVDAVDVVEPAAITARDAHRAGFATRAALLDALDGRPGAVHRVRLHLAGPDPRVELRGRGRVSADELAEVERRLDRFDAAGRRGPWTRAVLELIREHPGTRAADLAAHLGREKQAFKLDVRKLKELGLTESLETGYRLSPRGRAVLRRLT
ncbi:MAG TPA: hypothetical protein VF152_00430 [Acidimicrobiia bacterium]